MRTPKILVGIYLSTVLSIFISLFSCSDETAYKIIEEGSTDEDSVLTNSADVGAQDSNAVKNIPNKLGDHCLLGEVCKPGDYVSDHDEDSLSNHDDEQDNSDGGDQDHSQNDQQDQDGDGPKLVSATETFPQESSSDKKLDVLVVVDNSGSMGEEHQNLSNKLSNLLGYVRTADWQVALTTTAGTGAIAQLLKKSSAATQAEQDADFTQAVADFEQTVQNFGTNGPGNERGVKSATLALQQQVTGQNWVRTGSSLAILIVSDEDNCSDGGGCSGDEQNGNMLLNYLSQDLGRQLGTTAKVYGLIRRNAQECPSAYNVGNIYNSIISQTSGLAGAICDGDYSNTLEAISADIAVNLDLNFTLQHTPVAGSVQVTIAGVTYTSGFDVVGNMVVLQSIQPVAGEDVIISYQYEGP